MLTMFLRGQLAVSISSSSSWKQKPQISAEMAAATPPGTSEECAHAGERKENFAHSLFPFPIRRSLPRSEGARVKIDTCGGKHELLINGHRPCSLNLLESSASRRLPSGAKTASSHSLPAPSRFSNSSLLPLNCLHHP